MNTRQKLKKLKKKLQKDKIGYSCKETIEILEVYEYIYNLKNQIN